MSETYELLAQLAGAEKRGRAWRDRVPGAIADQGIDNLGPPPGMKDQRQTFRVLAPRAQG